MTVNNKTAAESSENGKLIISAPVVTHNFVQKNGVQTDRKEYYLELSVQDYFIKFCESQVSKEEVESYLAKQNGTIKSIKVEMEYRNGLWDVCKGNEPEQSRSGPYVVLYQIIK